MCSANTFKSAWRKACIRQVEKDDRFFLVGFDSSVKEAEKIWEELKSMGYRCLGPCNAMPYPYICVNINTKIFFSGYVGHETLGTDYIGTKEIGYQDFKVIHSIYNKQKGQNNE